MTVEASSGASHKENPMKTFFRIVAVAFLFTLFTPPAQAQVVFGPYKIASETTVAAGAVINSSVYDLEKLAINAITVIVDNSAAAGARNLSYKCYAKDGTTVIYTSADVAVSNVAPGNAMLYLDPRASSVTAATRQTIHPMPPCRKMSFHLAAAGAAAAGLYIYAR
jgi:hypothetical protein